MGNISRYFAVVLSTIPLVLAAWVTPPSIYNTSFPDVTWDNEAWTLTSRNPNNSDWYSQSFVSNGYIGSSFASTGPFPYTYDVSGGPYFNEHVTFSTVAGFFDRQPTTSFAAYPWLRQYGWESAISGIPAWGSIVLDLGNGIYLDGTIDETELSDITLQQNFQQGFASYSYTWTPAKLAGETLLISYLVFADKSYPNRAHVQMRLASSHAMQVKAVNIIDGSTALRTDPAQNGVDGQFIYTVVQPNGVNNVTAWIYSTLEGPGVNASTLSRITDEPYISNNPSTIAQMVNISLEPQQPVSVTKYVAIATTDAFTDPKAQARNESIAALETGFESAFQQHVEEWAKVFPRTAATSFVDPTTGRLPDHLVERQITSVVAAAILLMNTVSENALAHVNNAPINTFGLGVCGLLSDCYGGQRFWDQDIWMGPYLFATNPSAAKQISLSRVAFYRQSQINIESAYMGSKYNVSFSPGASNYAWSTGRDGNCTAFTPCWDYEYHINGDIVKGFIDYWSSSGDNALFEESLLPITNSIATFYSDLIELNQTTGMWVLTNMTDPDEYASFVNNGAYTMSLIQYTLLAANYFNSLFNQSQNNNWNSQAYTLEIPIDTQMDLTLEYSGMADSISIKQADVVLLTYPLNNINNATLDNQVENLNFYSSEEDLNGPGMTWAIYSIDSSALESSGCAAYTYDLYAWTPYLRAPWFTFSEQMDENNGGAYPFLTGLGGFLQIDLMGYLGLRYGPSLDLQVYPNLPPQIPYIRFPTFHFQGWPIEAEANQTHTTLKRTGKPLTTANPMFSSSSINVRLGRSASDTIGTFQLAPGGVLVLPNVDSGANSSLGNNILQCRPVVSSEPSNSPGQFPQAATDGTNSTVWLPAAGNNFSSLTVDLTSEIFYAVDYIFIEWATTPAANASVVFHNSSDFGPTSSSTRVDLANGSNTTNVSVSDRGIWTGRYATLLVTGDSEQTSSSAGQVGVAEWAVVVTP